MEDSIYTREFLLVKRPLKEILAQITSSVLGLNQEILEGGFSIKTVNLQVSYGDQVDAQAQWVLAPKKSTDS